MPMMGWQMPEDMPPAQQENHPLADTSANQPDPNMLGFQEMQIGDERRATWQNNATIEEAQP